MAASRDSRPRPAGLSRLYRERPRDRYGVLRQRLPPRPLSVPRRSVRRARSPLGRVRSTRVRAERCGPVPRLARFSRSGAGVQAFRGAVPPRARPHRDRSAASAHAASAGQRRRAARRDQRPDRRAPSTARRVSGTRYPRVASFKSADAFRRHLRDAGIALAFDDAPPAASALARPIEVGGVRVGNRFCILPMEGWDGTADGKPSDLTRRRWTRFGISGAKLIWGGEAVAVRHDGRANPNQLLLTSETHSAVASLRESLVAAHCDRFGGSADADLYVGLQLTHSGRYARPNATDRAEPRAAYLHPVLDRRFPNGVQLLSDGDLDSLVEVFVEAARLAWDAGFAFVDIKACHGYLGHELLSAVDRPGRYGGSLENRTRFLRSIIEGIRATAPHLAIAVRLSAIDTVPYRKTASGTGAAETSADSYRWAFGLLDGDMEAALADARAVLRILEQLNVRWICITAGSPYYNPHVQ